MFNSYLRMISGPYNYIFFFEIHFQNEEVCLIVLRYNKFIDYNEVRKNFAGLNIIIICALYFPTFYKWHGNIKHFFGWKDFLKLKCLHTFDHTVQR